MSHGIILKLKYLQYNNIHLIYIKNRWEMFLARFKIRKHLKLIDVQVLKYCLFKTVEKKSKTLIFNKNTGTVYQNYNFQIMSIFLPTCPMRNIIYN